MMNARKFVIGGKTVLLCGDEAPEILLLQPVDDHDASMLESEAAYISKHCERRFLLCGIKVDDWFNDLSPWEADAVFGENAFGSGAGKTLGYITDVLLPALESGYGISKSTERVIGGYSLAGLFALWSGCQTDAFGAVAAASPSVWFPEWIDYAKKHKMLAKAVSLSLGDREEKTKNPVMATVGRCIREQYEILISDGTVKVTLNMNEGNHFKEPDVRTAKSFLEVI